MNAAVDARAARWDSLLFAWLRTPVGVSADEPGRQIFLEIQDRNLKATHNLKIIARLNQIRNYIFCTIFYIEGC